MRLFLETYHGKKENKLLELYNLLDKQPGISQEEAALKLYKDAKSKAFIMTKTRLVERMYDVLTLGSSISNNEAVEEDQAAYDYIDAQKLLVLALTLRKRGLSWLSRSLLKDNLNNPEVVLHPSVRLRMLELLRMQLDKGMEDFREWEQIHAEIQLVQAQVRAENMLADYLYQMNVMQSIPNFAKDRVIRFLEESLQKIENNREEYLLTPHALYYFYRLHFGYAEMYNNVAEQRLYLDLMVEICRQHPNIEDKNRRFLTLHRAGTLEVREGNYAKAVGIAEEAKPLALNRPVNHLAILLLEAYARFYQGDTAGIDACVLAAQNLSNKEHFNVYLTKYMCCVKAYTQGDYKRFNQELSGLEPFFQNKYHYNAIMRVFEIMVYVEQGKGDLASSKIEALRKFIANNETEMRVVLAYKILHQLEMQAFDGKPNPKIEQFLMDLYEHTRWEAVGFEMIRIDVWYRAHLSRKTYLETWLEFGSEVGKS